jgi:DNA replication protein DnaC
MASSLLVLDEFGYQSMSREEANLFFRVVSYRYLLRAELWSYFWPN